LPAAVPTRGAHGHRALLLALLALLRALLALLPPLLPLLLALLPLLRALLPLRPQLRCAARAPA